MRFRDPALIWAVLLLLAAALFALLFVDRPLADAMTGAGPQSHAIAEFVTTFGRSTGYLIGLPVIAGILVLIGYGARSPRCRLLARWWAWACVFLFLAIALSGLTNDLVKILVGRPRPMFPGQDLQAFAFDYKFESFPSGHAATVFGLAFGAAALWPLWRWPLIVFAMAVAISRIVLNVHFLSDTIGSIVVALLTVRWLMAVSAKHGIVFQRRLDGQIRRRPIGLRQLIRSCSRRITPA